MVRLAQASQLSHLNEVEEAPRDDGVVVEGHVEGDHRGGDTDAAQARGHLVPHAYRALSQTLPDGQLQVEDGDALDAEHDKVRDEERPCNAANSKSKRGISK